MSDGGPAGAGSEESDGPGENRARKALLLGCCVFGLLVAALAVPPVQASLELGAAGSGGGGGEGGGGGSGVEDLLREIARDDADDTDGFGEPLCEVTVVGDPEPGRTVTVRVERDDAPVEDARVDFNGEPIGFTDEDGRVRGEVPYERELVVTATMPGVITCETTAGDSEIDDGPSSLADGHPLAAVLATEVTAPLGTASSSPPGEGPAAPVAQATGAGPATLGDNTTEIVDVEGNVRVRVVGEPDPGTEVTFEARIEDDPMPNASVAVNGRLVGRTDARGQLRYEIPDDRTRRLRVRVSRGEFSSTATVQVNLLTARIQPETVVALPGFEGQVVATEGDDEISGAVVRLDGEQVGTTGYGGAARFRFPLHPLATLSVSTDDQTVRKSIWPLYLGTIIVAIVPLSLLVGLVLILTRLGQAAAGSGRSFIAMLDALVMGIVGLALRGATRLGRMLDDASHRLRALFASLRASVSSLPTSLPALPGRLWAWLVALPGRTWAWLVATALWVYALPGRFWAWLRHRGDDGADEPTEPADVSVPGASEAGTPSSLRGQWRTFARWVTPNHWPRRAPATVAREAIEDGFPREAVATLATVFREVEYGGRPLSQERREQAREAFEELLSYRQGDDGETAADGGEVSD